MKRLRLGAVLHFIIAASHIGCLFALDEAFEPLWEAGLVWWISIGCNLFHSSFQPFLCGAIILV